MIFTPHIIKLNSFYGAYAPEFDICAYGDCRDEALNNLSDELAIRGSQGRERKSDAV